MMNDYNVSSTSHGEWKMYNHDGLSWILHSLRRVGSIVYSVCTQAKDSFASAAAPASCRLEGLRRGIQSESTRLLHVAFLTPVPPGQTLNRVIPSPTMTACPSGH